jgi:hypothetical protein
MLLAARQVVGDRHEQHQLEQFRGLEGERPDREPPARALRGVAHDQDTRQHGEPESVAEDGPARERAVVDRQDNEHDDERHADPEELAHREPRDQTPQGQEPRRDKERDEPDQDPVEVEQEPAVDPQHRSANRREPSDRTGFAP